MALLPNPRVLFLDEPFEAIDPVTSQDHARPAANRGRAAGITVFLTSHILSVAEQIATQVVMIRKGKIVWNSPVGRAAAVAGAALLRLGGIARGGGTGMARPAAILRALGRPSAGTGSPSRRMAATIFFLVTVLLLGRAGGYIYS